ncbi:MAG: hypothetical protein AAGG38_10470 [Planctomycetota bacterium]
MLTTTQAGKRLGCSSEHIRELIRREQLHGVNIAALGKRPTYRVPDKAIEAYEVGHTVRACGIKPPTKRRRRRQPIPRYV